MRRTGNRVRNVRASVIVRSLNRPRALMELVERLLVQEHDDFEVVIVDQTARDRLPEGRERLRFDRMMGDPRTVYLRREPLGGPGARNEGVRHARGELLLFIDDDDLPVGTDWIRGHEAIYEDSSIIGATARHIRMDSAVEPSDTGYGPLTSWWARHRCMRYSFLGFPHTLAQLDEDIERVDWLHGTNSSLRREAIERAGMWDESVSSQDEHSFAMRLQRTMRPEERLVFRRHPPVIRRTDIAGGMDKRRRDVEQELRNQFDFVHRVLLRYRPVRTRVLYGPITLAATARALEWIWNGRNASDDIGGNVEDTVRMGKLVLRTLVASARERVR